MMNHSFRLLSKRSGCFARSLARCQQQGTTKINYQQVYQQQIIRLYSKSVVYSVSEARQKLTAIMMEYREQNFSQTVPKRYVKQLLQAVDKNKDGLIDKDELQQFLTNIGQPKGLTDEEIDIVLNEMTDGDDKIPVDDVKEYILNEITKK